METFDSLIKKYNILIPKLQRDYAQGRESAQKIRNSFLDKIEGYLLKGSEEKLHLDFVYGYTNRGSDRDTFIPLDGQQRLTTLFLLFWYASRFSSEIIQNKEISSLLKGFSYETRLSSERFCHKLVNSNMEILNVKILSDYIKNQHWFVRNWENDPTVKAMLVMLDSIHMKFAKSDNLMQELLDRPITFKLIDIKSDNFKLTDELYIKMNSRGRALTDFENFKAEFSEILKSEKTDYYKDIKKYQYKSEYKDVSYQQYFSLKIDSEWTDLFWNHPKRKDYKIDGLLYNYFNTITQVLFYIQNGDKSENADDINYEFSIDILKQVYSHKQNVDILFASLDFHSSLENVTSFYNSLFTTEFSTKKVRLFDNEEVDLFGKVIEGNISVFEQILFYSLCLFKKETGNDIFEEDFSFLRIIRNIFMNVRQVDAKNRINIISDLRINRIFYYNKFIEKFVENIKKLNSSYEAIRLNYDVQFINRYIALESDKLETITSSDRLEYLYGLENHRYIKANLESIAFNNDNIKDYYKVITQVWSENELKKEYNVLICQALLCFGNYSITSHTDSALGAVKYFGVNNYWQRILSPINDKEKLTTQSVLRNLCDINKFSEDTVEFLRNVRDDKLGEYDDNIEKDWIYYFLKYDEILSSDYNLFTWSENGFDINIIGSTSRQPLSSYHYNPYLKLIANSLNLDNIKFYYERYSETSFISINDKLYVYFEEYGLQIGVYEDYDFDLSTLKSVKGNINSNQLLEVIIDNKLDRVDACKEILLNLLKEIN